MDVSKGPKRRVVRDLYDCRWQGCALTATHGLAEGWRPFYCTAHAVAFNVLVPLDIPKCAKCDARALFGITDKHVPSLCKAHVDTPSRCPVLNMCAACASRGGYGPHMLPRGESFAPLCARHGKLVNGFRDAVSQKCVDCAREGKSTIAWFGPQTGKSKRIHCKAHVTSGDINHCKKPKCIVCADNGVDRDASYPGVGEEGDLTRIDAKFCEEHQLLNDDGTPATHSLANYKCAECGVFAVKAKKDKCAQCKKKVEKEYRRTETREGKPKGKPLPATNDNESNVPVRHISGMGYACKHSGCKSHAFYGVDNTKTHCAVHKAADATRLSKAYYCTVCAAEGSAKWATWTSQLGTPPTRCLEHILPGMINIHLRYKCVICLTTAVRGETSVCYECRKTLPRTKTAEKAVHSVLKKDGLGQFIAIQDAAVPCRPTGTPAFRPDFVWLPKDRAVILEVDEHAHRFYEPSCEVARLHQLHESLAPRALLVLRYNPHAPGYAASKHAIVCGAVRALFVRDLPANGLHVEYMGYPPEQIAELKEVEEDMHAAAEDMATISSSSGSGSKKRAHDDDMPGTTTKKARTS